MKFLVGTKKGMSQVFDADGAVHPVTIIAAPAITVTQVKTADTDGYTAVQVGYGSQKAERINNAQKKKGSFKGFTEFRLPSEASAQEGGYEVGKQIGVDTFAEGDLVVISGITKGKGFQGVVKRHGFHGGPRSHGQKHSEREPGSIGGGPGRAGGRVVRGMRMAGRMGGDRMTFKNMKIVRVDAEKGEIMIEGQVPGKPGTVIELVQK